MCASGDGAIFLDLKRDTYLGIDAEQARALSTVVQSWPCASAEPETDNPSVLGLANALCARGVLALAATMPCSEVPATFSPATSELISWDRMQWRHIRPRHVWHFFAAIATAMLLIRSRPFISIVERVQRRKARHASRGGSFDMHAAAALLSAYVHIRLFVYRSKSRCLLDSLALVEFLARQGVHPEWIVGVQVHPFAAHSWVQHEACVLNGTASYVRAYTPILIA